MFEGLKSIRSRLCWYFLVGIVIILLLYDDNIVLLARCPFDLDKQLQFLKICFFTMGMTVNTEKKVMIIKCNNDTYANFVYNNSNLED